MTVKEFIDLNIDNDEQDICLFDVENGEYIDLDDDETYIYVFRTVRSWNIDDSLKYEGRVCLNI